MDPTACFRKAWADVSTQKTEQPQDDENYDDSPEHEITPFDVLAEWHKLHGGLADNHRKWSGVNRPTTTQGPLNTIGGILNYASQMTADTRLNIDW